MMRTLGLLVGAATVLALPSEIHAQAGRARVLEGNRLYEEGRFDEAHRKYLEALAEAPDVPVIPFNDGNALYRGSDFAGAMEAYRRAIESGDPALASAAWYNLGNTLYRAQELEASLEAFKQALRLAPDDVDAKHNLERVLEQMQEQEQDQQQDGEDGEQDDQEEPDQDQPPSEGDDPSEEPQDQSGEDEGQDEPQDRSSQPDSGDDSPEEGESEQSPPPGEMSPEEARRMLEAVDEDPGDVNRRPVAATGRRPRKAW